MTDNIVLRNPQVGGTDHTVRHPEQPAPYLDQSGTWTWQSDQAWRLVNGEHLRVYDLEVTSEDG